MIITLCPRSPHAGPLDNIRPAAHETWKTPSTSSTYWTANHYPHSYHSLREVEATTCHHQQQRSLSATTGTTMSRC